MGAYSTIWLSRKEAVERIIEGLDEATDEEIANCLFGLTQFREYDNYVVGGEEPEWNKPYEEQIKSINEENTRCTSCGSENVGEASLYDDWDGMLTCYDCKNRFERWK